MIEQLHFLRPQWLLALLPLCVLVFWSWRRGGAGGAWQAVCDPHLVAFVLEQGSRVKRARHSVLMTLAGGLAILALAGPAWQQLPQPVFKQKSALVVMLDLSRSMDAGDVNPSRLQRARLKLLDLLALRKEGQTALIAFAGDAFVVTPLTDDTDTIAALTQSLTTALMPVQGSRADRAVEQALQLLSQAGASTGSLLLITDGVAADEVDSLADMVTAAGHRLSVLGVGTAEAAPIPDGAGGFLKDQAGKIVLPKLDELPLINLAERAGGMYAAMQIQDDDIERLLRHTAPNRFESSAEETKLRTDRWREEGPWLLLLLLPIAALTFRRGLLTALVCLGLQWPDPLLALEVDDLWLNSNQRGARAMTQEDYQAAAGAFEDLQWKAAAHYRAGNFDQAIESLQGAETPTAAYNRGNALARLGRIDEAIESYENALAQDPGHADAEFNLDLLKQLKQQQQDQQQQDQQQQDQQQQQQQQQQDQGSGDQPQRSEQNQQQHGQGEEAEDSSDESQEGGQDSEQRQVPSDQQEKAQQEQPQAGEQSEKPEQGEKQKQLQQSQEQQPGQAPEQQAEREPAPTEEQQAQAQWLRRVPDDPAGLLRRKFRYQYSQRYENIEPEARQW